MGNHGADVAAAVNDLFEQVIKVFQNNDFQRVVAAAEQIAVKFHDGLVGIALDLLQPVVPLFDLFEVDAGAEAFDEVQDAFCGVHDQLDLLGEIHAANVLGRELDAFAEFFHGLGDAVKRQRQGVNVLAFERGDEGGVNGVADLVGDFLVLAPGVGKRLQFDGLVERLAQSDQRLDAVVGLERAGLEQAEKQVFFAEQFLE